MQTFCQQKTLSKEREQGDYIIFIDNICNCNPVESIVGRKEN
jgi:hypothetical protein